MAAPQPPARHEVDPRYLIAQANGYADHDTSSGWHAVNLELTPASAGNRPLQRAALRQLLGTEGRIAQAHLDAPADLGAATAEVTAAGLQRLEQQVRLPAGHADKLLRRFEYAQPLKAPRLRPAPGLQLPADAAAAAAATSAQARGAKSRAGRVVLAVIDHGCPFLHPLLCTQTVTGPSTRVRALWDQQTAPSADPYTRPKGFDYGTELSRAQLDAVGRAAAGDEDRAYATLGYQSMRRRTSHGAHLLGMLLDDGQRPRGGPRPAQPADRSAGAGQPPDVLFVQLPQSLLGAPNRAVLSRHLVDALVWIQSQCAADERIVLSLSEGSSQGPHDGSSFVEQALQSFTRWGRRGRARHRIYIAAGNGFEEQLHAQALLQPSAPTSWLWRLPPGSELPASVEVWLPLAADGSVAEVRVDLDAPDGRQVASVMPGQVAQVSAAGPAAAADPAPAPIASLAASAWLGDGCSLCLLRLAPTAAARGQARAPFGDWTIRLTAAATLPGPVHLYIGRIKPALGFPLRTAQSTFVTGTRRGYGGATGEGTLQGLATAGGVTCVGGVVGATDAPGEPKAARYASRGPLRNRSGGGPALSVRVDDGPVLKGRRSIGNRSSVSFRMDGTSVGAPLAARLDGARKAGPPAAAGPNGELLPDPAESWKPG